MRFIVGLFLSLCLISQAWAGEVWTIAIDPGHGGKDPGAVGKRLRLYEKNVTFSIAKELQKLLAKDPRFKPILTRTGDYFIAVSKRSEIARRAKADYLVSIHADSARNVKARGASVWVLSTRRANSEMGQWLEDHEKRSDLLGGAGIVLGSRNDVYLNKTVLDLQFVHSQQVGYELGQIVLRQFKKITEISRNTPQHASLGVLRSPDIPSILVETGFLSNRYEEQQLNSPAYRKKVAYMIYQSLVNYYQKQMALASKSQTKTSFKKAQAPRKTISQPNITTAYATYTVASGDNLGKIANKFKVSVADIKSANNLSNSQIRVGQKLNIPQEVEITDPFSVLDEEDLSGTNYELDLNPPVVSRPIVSKPVVKTSTRKKTTAKTSPKYYKVRKGDTFSEIAERFNTTTKKLRQLNPKIKRDRISIGQRIRVK